MRLAILGSGSSGNVALVESGGTRVLVDAGLSVAAITRRLEPLGVALDQIDALLVTHEHSDHVGCAATLGRPIYAPGATLLKKRLAAEPKALAPEPSRQEALLQEIRDLLAARV